MWQYIPVAYLFEVRKVVYEIKPYMAYKKTNRMYISLVSA